MAAMTIATPVALAGARPLKATLCRAVSAVPLPCVRRPAARSRSAPRSLDYNAETPMTYNETGKWRENFDLAAWASEVRQVEKELKAEIGEDDVDHLNKILTWANMFYYGGLAVLFATPFLTNIFLHRRRQPHRRVHDVHRHLRQVDHGRSPRLPRRLQHRAVRERP